MINAGFVSAVLGAALMCGQAFAASDVTAAKNEKLQNNPKYLQLDMSSVQLVDITDSVKANKGGSLNHGQKPTPGSVPVDQVPAPQTVPAPVDTNSANSTPDGTTPAMSATDAINLADQIVNLAKKVFDIIAENKPVVDVTVNYANAIPANITHWTQLQQWEMPATRTYAFTAKNMMGSKVVDVKYQVIYTYGGNFNGKGKYLTGVSVEPLSVNVGWGYKFSMTCEVPDSTVANVGTTENPIASMNLILKWKMASVLKESDGRNVYYVRGDGAIKEIGSAYKIHDPKDIKTLEPLMKK